MSTQKTTMDEETALKRIINTTNELPLEYQSMVLMLAKGMAFTKIRYTNQTEGEIESREIARRV